MPTPTTPAKAAKAEAPAELFTCVMSGRVVCFAHLGYSGQAAVKATPRPPMGEWMTDLNVWVRLTPAEVAEIASWGINPGEPMCEDCRENAQRAAAAAATVTA